MKTFNYHCIRCNKLILSSKTRQDVDNFCFSCNQKDTNQAIERQKHSINLEFGMKKIKKMKKKYSAA